MLYNLIRKLSYIATYQFFSEIHFNGADSEEEGPLLIVANHPAVMLDGLLVLAAYRRVIWFIAKSTIFKGQLVNWLLGSLKFVPVQRRQDDARKMESNRDSFRFICDALFARQALLIFPEGQSKAMRQILPVKTGAARIAFQAESESDFMLGLRIQAVGLTYSDFQRFRSSVTVTKGIPIRVAEYKQQYETDPAEAVRILSEKISEDLKNLTLEVYNESQIPLVEKINKLYKSKRLGVDDKARMEVVADHVRELEPKLPKLAKLIEKRITLYLQLAAAFRLDASEDFELENNPFYIAVLCPLVLLGIFINYPVYRVVSSIGRSFSHGNKSQLASYAISFAFVLFPLWYIFLGVLFGSVQNSYVSGVLFTLLMFLSGWAVARHLHSVALFLFSTFWPAKRSPVDLIRDMRDSLIEELESIRGDHS